MLTKPGGARGREGERWRKDVWSPEGKPSTALKDPAASRCCLRCSACCRPGNGRKITVICSQRWFPLLPGNTIPRWRPASLSRRGPVDLEARPHSTPGPTFASISLQVRLPERGASPTAPSCRACLGGHKPSHGAGARLCSAHWSPAWPSGRRAPPPPLRGQPAETQTEPGISPASLTEGCVQCLPNLVGASHPALGTGPKRGWAAQAQLQLPSPRYRP